MNNVFTQKFITELSNKIQENLEIELSDRECDFIIKEVEKNMLPQLIQREQHIIDEVRLYRDEITHLSEHFQAAYSTIANLEYRIGIFEMSLKKQEGSLTAIDAPIVIEEKNAIISRKIANLSETIKTLQTDFTDIVNTLSPLEK